MVPDMVPERLRHATHAALPRHLHNHDSLDPHRLNAFPRFFRNSGGGSLLEFFRENRPIRAEAIEFLENSASAE